MAKQATQSVRRYPPWPAGESDLQSIALGLGILYIFLLLHPFNFISSAVPTPEMLVARLVTGLISVWLHASDQQNQQHHHGLLGHGQFDPPVAFFFDGPTHSQAFATVFSKSSTDFTSRSLEIKILEECLVMPTNGCTQTEMKCMAHSLKRCARRKVQSGQSMNVDQCHISPHFLMHAVHVYVYIYIYIHGDSSCMDAQTSGSDLASTWWNKINIYKTANMQ